MPNLSNSRFVRPAPSSGQAPESVTSSSRLSALISMRENRSPMLLVVDPRLVAERGHPLDHARHHVRELPDLPLRVPVAPEREEVSRLWRSIFQYHCV